MPLLEAAVRRFDEVSVEPPPSLAGLGVRLRALYANDARNGYSQIPKRAVRQLPFAIWLGGEPALMDIAAMLVARYWHTTLPFALASGTRAAKRWLTPLFFTYCEEFNPHDIQFREFSERIAAALESAVGEYAEHLRSLHKDYAYFDSENAPLALAHALFGREDFPLQDMRSLLLCWDGFGASRLGTAILRSALSGFLDTQIRQEHTLIRLLKWVEDLKVSISKLDEFRVFFADRILGVWANTQPLETTRKTLCDFFLRHYGDPRLAGNRTFQWRGVSQKSLNVLLAWLTGDTLRLFMKILEDTADDIWRHRQAFWMAYYNQQHIEEAWVVLGEEAASRARRLRISDSSLVYGRLYGSAPDKSVLIMRMGDLILVEWSHDGALRAYRQSAPDIPELYQTNYQASELRAVKSLDFHDGANMNPELRHSGSDSGSWQRKARDFFRKNVGVYLPDREILL
jgi:hypothetical protein